MKVEHVAAMWTKDIEKSKKFYGDYFDGIAFDKFTCYALTIMSRRSISGRSKICTNCATHCYLVVGEPGYAGDGYYEGANCRGCQVGR
jgi:hypothetical protein